MAGGFAVANPRPVDLGSGLSQAGDNLVRVASLLEQKRQREEEDRTRAILGASQSDIGIYAPEVIEQLQSATNPEDRNRILANSGQIAAVRKQQHMDLLQQAAAIQQANATPGMDPGPLVAAHQTALTSSGLPPGLIASQQSALGTASFAGQTARAATQEDRSYSEGQRAKDRQLRLGDQAAAEVRDDERWQRRHAVEQSDAISREGRAEKAETARMYKATALSLGLPDGTPRDVIDAANAASVNRKSQLTPQQLSANNSLSVWMSQVRKSKDAKGGSGGMGDIIQYAVDGVSRAGSSNATMIPVPIETSSGLFGSTYTLELKDASHAQFYLEKLDAKAYKIDKETGKHIPGPDGNPIVLDEDAARFMRAYAEAATTGKNQWLVEAMSPGTKSQEQIDAERKDAGLSAPTDPELGGPKVTKPAPRGSSSATVMVPAEPTVEYRPTVKNDLKRQLGSAKGKKQEPYRPGNRTR